VCEQTFFSDVLKQSGATPLLWTNNLMAPEAYVLSAAIDGWMKKKAMSKSASAPLIPITVSGVKAS
jgi:hypothetical protein